MNFILDFYHSQSFSTNDLAVVAVLTVLEGVLSIDNALVLSLLARRLPKEYQARALNWGMMLAFLFRFVAIFMAALLLRWTIVKFFGGAYLVYIAVRHLFFETKQAEADTIALDEHGRPKLVESTGKELADDKAEEEIRERVPLYVRPQTGQRALAANFWPTVATIGLTDIAFAVDSILAAIALVGSPPDPTQYHPKLWVVFAGGGLGMIVLRFAAAMFIKLMERFPRFEISAYLLVAVIGFKLLADWGANSDWQSWSPQREQTRRSAAESYEQWLHSKWIFKIEPHEEPAGALARPPHLLDFHDLRRPESMAFWLLMVGSFCTGFIPPRKKPAVAGG